MKASGRLLRTAQDVRNGRRPSLGMATIKSHLRPSGAFRVPAVHQSFMMCSPRYFMPALTRNAEEVEYELATEPAEESERWIAILENTAAAPWLFALPPVLENRLKLAYTLLFQIVLYLSRPMDPEQAEQFLVAFGTAVVPPESEIGRARSAIIPIIHGVVRQISSIPINSTLRTEQPEIFEIFGALQAIHDMYLMDSAKALEIWSEIWPRAQPVILELGMKLDEKGFGFNMDELNDARQPEEKSE